MAKNLSEVLAILFHLPRMFLAERKATLLEAFVYGYLVADNAAVSDRIVMSDFREWLWKKPGITPDQSFAHELIQLTHSDGKAFEAFFDYFDSFLAETGAEFPRPSTINVNTIVAKFDSKGNRIY